MTHVGTIAAARLYWAVLDTDGLSAAAIRDPKRLGYLFEEFLPTPIEELQAAYTPIGEEGRGSPPRILACGIDRDRLTRLLERPDATSWTRLHPVELGPALDIHPDSVSLAAINLLTGDFEPARVRRLGRWVWMTAAAALCVVTAAGSVGFARQRAELLREFAAQEAALGSRLWELVGPSGAPRGASVPRLELALESQLVSLQITRGGDLSQDHDATSLIPVFASLLTYWPDESQIEDLHLNRVSLRANRIDISGQIGDPAALEWIRDTLDQWPGWAARTSETRRTGGGSQVSFGMTITREEARP